MTIPEPLFTFMLWAGIVCLCLGAGFLIVVLVREWMAGDLW